MNRPIANADDASRRRPTIADVARRAGVSPALVSFAVNDRPGVSAPTRERILTAAKELRWRPSASARALTQARTQTVGLVLSRGTDELEVDSFFVRFLSGVERTLAQADHAMLLQLVPAADAGATLGAYERLITARRVDGFLLTDPELDDPRFPLLAQAAVPTVIAGRPAAASPFTWLETEHDRGITLAVEHLAGLGHGPPAFARDADQRTGQAVARAHHCRRLVLEHAGGGGTQIGVGKGGWAVGQAPVTHRLAPAHIPPLDVLVGP